MDCGGPCRQFCIPADLTPIQVSGEPRVFQPIPELVSVMVKLQNPNTTFSAREFSYTLTIHGEGSRTKTISGTSFIYAGDIKYLAFLENSAEVGRPVRAEFVVSSPVWVPQGLFAKPSLRVQSQTASTTEDGSLRVEGIVANDDTRAARTISLVALFMGSRGELVGVSQTELDALDVGATSPFVIVHPLIEGAVAASTQVFVSGVRP